MVGDSANNTIGGVNGLNPDGSLNVFNGNVISGNLRDGVQFNGTETTSNQVIGNRIGTDLSGTRHVPTPTPEYCSSFRASNNTIGTASLDGSAANLISGNRQSGIEMRDTTTGNRVLGNRIGLSGSGMATVPNLGDGIVLNAAGNVVGGTTPGPATSSPATSGRV